jgi:hypothetical protein
LESRLVKKGSGTECQFSVAGRLEPFFIARVQTGVREVQLLPISGIFQEP